MKKVQASASSTLWQLHLAHAMHYSSGQQLMSIWLRPLPLLPYKHTPVRLYSLWIQNRIIRQSCCHFTVTYWGINFLHQNCFISWSRKYLQGVRSGSSDGYLSFQGGGGVWGIFSVILYVNLKKKRICGGGGRSLDQRMYLIYWVLYYNPSSQLVVSIW